ncbi:MAG: hypothetical protein ACO1RT_02970 [Planctomycetaceae bacterium]
MILGIATVSVIVLLAIALLPVRTRDIGLRQSSEPTFQVPTVTRPINLRQQQVQEEATAIASEYHRRADQIWLEELKAKAALMLTPEKR